MVANTFYNDFALLNAWHSSEVYFVVRHKSNIKFKTKKELELPANRHQHILKDEIIKLTGQQDKRKIPLKTLKNSIVR